LLHGDYQLGKQLESDTEINFGSRRATLRKRFPRRIPDDDHFPPPTIKPAAAVPQKLPSSSSISFFDSFKVTNQADFQRQLNATTAITTTTVSNLCVNFLTNQPLTPVDVLLMGVIVGVIVGIVVGVFVASVAVIVL